MNNADMLREYSYIDGDELGEYCDRLLDFYESFTRSVDMSTELQNSLEAEIVRLLMFYKEHSIIEDEKETIERKTNHLIWDL